MRTQTGEAVVGFVENQYNITLRELMEVGETGSGSYETRGTGVGVGGEGWGWRKEGVQSNQIGSGMGNKSVTPIHGDSIDTFS